MFICSIDARIEIETRVSKAMLDESRSARAMNFESLYPVCLLLDIRSMSRFGRVSHRTRQLITVISRQQDFWHTHCIRLTGCSDIVLGGFADWEQTYIQLERAWNYISVYRGFFICLLGHAGELALTLGRDRSGKGSYVLSLVLEDRYLNLARVRIRTPDRNHLPGLLDLHPPRGQRADQRWNALLLNELVNEYPVWEQLLSWEVHSGRMLINKQRVARPSRSMNVAVVVVLDGKEVGHWVRSQL